MTEKLLRYDSAVRRTLEIPEILGHVFSFLDNQSNTKNALVCKKWSEPAFDNIWQDVSEPRILFRLLAPLIRNLSQPKYVRDKLPSSL